jgi:hypothetical protein
MDKSDTSQLLTFSGTYNVYNYNLTPTHVNHYPTHMITCCQFKVLLFFSVFYQLTLIVIVLQTVNTKLKFMCPWIANIGVNDDQQDATIFGLIIYS